MINLKSIEFIFDNCESLIINYPDIFYLHTGEIHKSICSSPIGITYNNNIDGFTIGIKNPGPKYGCGIDQHPLLGPARLSVLDVAYLNLTFDDNKKQSLAINWPEGNPYYSCKGQQFITTNDGHYLFIFESKDYKSALTKKELDDFYNLVLFNTSN